MAKFLRVYAHRRADESRERLFLINADNVDFIEKWGKKEGSIYFNGSNRVLDVDDIRSLERIIYHKPNKLYIDSYTEDGYNE